MGFIESVTNISSFLVSISTLIYISGFNNVKKQNNEIFTGEKMC